jgi:uncharacterized SAM-binding protein YcdF (DUF218 family)
MAAFQSRPETGRRSAFARAVRLVLFFAVAVSVLIAGSFLWFVWLIPSEEIVLDAKADGIVVLTGGSSRISDAVELLASKRGRRLLISGVNPATRQQEIARLMPEYKKIFECCVDLDRSALNTVGNAVETRRWAKDQGFKSLIVVTSNYHIPRAMAELSHQLPEASLIAFPVVTHRLTDMWSNEATARLLFFEYLKYMVAQVRMRLDTVT